jgi:nucleoside-diphosphate-sugar epimerase
VHHVHAADVAQVAFRAIAHPKVAIGEAFNALSPQAMNLKGYAEAMYRWFEHEPHISYQPFGQWKQAQLPEDAENTWEHIIRSPAHSIEKARKLLGYEPKYSSLDAVKESVTWLVENGKLG